MEAENDLEDTTKVTQREIMGQVNAESAGKVFSLSLPGAYVGETARGGSSVVLGSRKGHLAVFDWRSKTVTTEVQVGETVRDVCFLHNKTMFAAAQKKHIFIYNERGAEMHCLRGFSPPRRIAFLPYHFLLVSTHEVGTVCWRDTSTGQLVVEHKAKAGAVDALRLNPANALAHLGTHSGLVTLWSPNLSEPAITVKCHKAPVKDVAVHRSGEYMVTAGLDSNKVRLWDLRMTYECLSEFKTPEPAQCLDISDMGLVACAHGRGMTVVKGFSRSEPEAYLTHRSVASINRLRFPKHEDLVFSFSGEGGATRAKPGQAVNGGFESLAVPGSGEGRIDAFEENPFATRKQLREAEVQALLNKIPADMITLRPLGGVLHESEREVKKKDEWEEKRERADKAMAQVKEKKQERMKRVENDPLRRFFS